MSKMIESDIELMAVEQLEGLGYTYVYGPDIESKGNNPLRSYKQFILESKVLDALQRLNPQLSDEKCIEALKRITNIQSPDLLSNNQSFHRLLIEGINIEIAKEGNTQGELAWLIDFNEPMNNEFLVVNQVTIREDRWERRPDVILYVNGLPLVVIELKNAADENATVEGAYKQIQTYKSQIQSLFTYNAFNIISDGLEAKAGTISADLSRYMAWKTTNGQTKAKKTQAQLEVLIQGLLNPVTLLDMIRHFIVFESSKQEDAKGLITVNTIKKMAAYHQYYAVNAAVLSTIRASAVNSDSKSAEAAMLHQGRNKLELVQQQAVGDKKAGVVWHTQGSGKSLSMVFYTGKIVLALDNPTVVVITDRNDLDDQLFGTFAASSQLLRQTPKQADSREELKELLKVGSGGVIFTTIQKFQPDDGGSVYEELPSRTHIALSMALMPKKLM